MAGQTISITPANSTVAQFRAWGSAISAAVAANGQVQTADTGQINWTTVALPGTNNTAGGYEIWRFADSLQSTAPVYIKLEYGYQTGNAPQVWLTVGTGSDGAGTITGVISGVLSPQIAPRVAIGSTAGAATAVPTTSYVNGTTGCLAVLLCPNNNTVAWAGMMMLVERTKDAAGADTGDGLLVLWANSSSAANANSCFLTYLPGVRSSQTALGYLTSWPLITTTFGGAIQTMTVNGVVYPAQVMTATGPKAGGPSQYVLGVTTGDIAAGAVVAISHYGTSRNWYAAGMGNSSGINGWGPIGTSGSDLALLRSFLFRIN